MVPHALPEQNLTRRLQQRIHLVVAADGDAQKILRLRTIEPTHKNLSLAQLLEPAVSREGRRANEKKIGLTRKHAKAEHRQFARRLLARRDDALEIFPVVSEVIERRQRGKLTEAVDVVTVADFVERDDELGVTDKVADALETERVSL